ncbi:helix-turn-helix domain-containing protein [Ulvibacterium sp.]|uniref:helix-turn-helix domain-containing protein n=1 Tax=Ulvibacterium sp. TaxID=2665914 RepID=UPI003BA8CF28
MRFESIKEFNTYTNLRLPKHDLIDIGEYPNDFLLSSPSVYPNFYRISIKYGLENDREKGFMYFSSPNQPIEWKTDTPWKGYFINITEDLISNNQHLEYSFLNYGLHEPLFLKREEEIVITHQFKAALEEYNKAAFSKDLVLAYCNVIFAHVAQFYKRQFGERKERYSQLVNDFFSLLDNYYGKDGGPVQPSVNYFANQLNVTPNYLSDVIKFYSGKPALEHIHQHIVKVAKSMLMQKKSTISEIAYQLGFEYPNYFSRLFRKITGVSPSNFSNL